MLSFQQFRQRYAPTQRFTLLLLALFALQLGIKQPSQTNSTQHYVDVSISSSILEVLEVEAEGQDDPFTPTNLGSPQTNGVLANSLGEQAYTARFSSQSYTQPPTRAPPAA